MEAKLQYVELDTDMETFAYWLERDWPRVKEFSWLVLHQNYAAQTDARFERKWGVYLRTPIPNFSKMPICEIFAESVAPGKVTVVWALSPPGHIFQDRPSPIESMGDWVWYRFQEEADTPDADGDHVALADMSKGGDHVALADMSKGGDGEISVGRRWEPRAEADKWLIEQYFEVYKERRRPGTFVEGWLAKRKELDANENALANPADNVRQLVSKERVRRKKNMNE